MFLEWKSDQDLASSSLTRDELPCPVFCLKVKISMNIKRNITINILGNTINILGKHQPPCPVFCLQVKIRKYLNEY